MSDKKIRTMVLAAVLAALACVATMVVQIPSPMNGYVNLGDCFVLLSGWLLGPWWGAAAGGIGSMLADLLLGYGHYAPGTLVIKGLMALVGAGWAYTPIPLTDQLFTVCLWLALALGTLAMRRGGAGFWISHFVLLGAAASVRPVLALFPLAFAALMCALRGARPWRRLVWVVAVQAILCQAPALRNYVHHGVWIPSDVAVNNLSDYWARGVLAWTGQPDLQPTAEAGWKELPLNERLSAQTAFARSALAAHPVVAAGVLAVNFSLNTLETHWIQPMHFFRSSLHCDLKRWCALTPGLKLFHSIWAAINAILVLAALAGVWRLARARQWAWLVFIAVFVLPYVYGATDAQGARFRLYLEALILMLALPAFSVRAKEPA